VSASASARRLGGVFLLLCVYVYVCACIMRLPLPLPLTLPLPRPMKVYDYSRGGFIWASLLVALRLLHFLLQSTEKGRRKADPLYHFLFKVTIYSFIQSLCRLGGTIYKQIYKNTISAYPENASSQQTFWLYVLVIFQPLTGVLQFFAFLHVQADAKRCCIQMLCLETFFALPPATVAFAGRKDLSVSGGRGTMARDSEAADGRFGGKGGADAMHNSFPILMPVIREDHHYVASSAYLEDFNHRLSSTGSGAFDTDYAYRGTNNIGSPPSSLPTDHSTGHISRTSNAINTSVTKPIGVSPAPAPANAPANAPAAAPANAAAAAPAPAAVEDVLHSMTESDLAAVFLHNKQKHLHQQNQQKRRSQPSGSGAGAGAGTGALSAQDALSLPYSL